MKKITSLAAFAIVVALAAPAMATETITEAAQEVQDSANAVAKDNAAIQKHEKHMNQDRASKAGAKAVDDKSTQAKESVKIGGHKAAIAGKKVEKKIDEKILEKDKEDLQEAINEGKVSE